MHKEEDTMSEVVVVGSWCVTTTTSPRLDAHLSWCLLTNFLPVSSVWFHGLRIWSKPLVTPLFWISFPLSQQEIVPLRKICRRPETDYRLQQLHSAANDFANSNQLQKPAPDAAATTPLQQSGASVPIVPTKLKDPRLTSASATSVQPSSNAATVPAGSA